MTALEHQTVPASAAISTPFPDRRWLLIFGAGFALLYWLLRSCSLDEWDSVLFAQGVLEFDLSRHQPHPPGYPLYIFFGRLLHALGLPVQQALVTISALTGGLYVATWLAMAWRTFGRNIALPFAVGLAGIIGVSLTAGKALTDMPASAFMALQLWFCLQPREKRFALIFAAICGGIAAGFRPQNVGVTLLLVIAARWLGGRSWKEVGLAVLAFTVVCLGWLIPMMIAQAQAMHTDNLFVYFERVNNQWTSRYTKPNTFIGAGDWSAKFLIDRFAKHFGWAWFYLGFGFHPQKALGVIGYLLLAAAAIGLFFKKRGETVPAQPKFWRWQLVWAVPYVLTIFICLPADPRYYVPVFPLILLPVVLGFSNLPKAGPWLRWSFAGLAWLIALPLAWEMHTEMPSPTRAMEWLRTQYPPEERKNVWVWLNDSYRHAQWYAPEFNLHSVIETATPPPGAIVYCELFDSGNAGKGKDVRPELPRRLGTIVNSTEAGRFSRPRQIHRKHWEVILYKLDYDPKIPKSRKTEGKEEKPPGETPAAAQP